MIPALLLLALACGGCRAPEPIPLPTPIKPPLALGTLAVQAVAPRFDAEGCVPVEPNASPRVWVHFAIAGAHDSVPAWLGDTVRWQRRVPAGRYMVSSWASDAGGAGCPESVLVTVKLPTQEGR